MVVEVHPSADAGPGFAAVGVGFQMNLLILDRAPSSATFALDAASNLLRGFVISLAPSVKQSRTLHTLTAGPNRGPLQLSGLLVYRHAVVIQSLDRLVFRP